MTRKLTRGRGVTLAAVALIGLTPAPRIAAAQKPPDPVVEFSAGWVGFPDDGEIVDESLFGGSFRWYASPRVSFGPEVQWINGSHHRHLVLTGNVIFDVIQPAAGKPRAVTPFVVLGGGIFQTRESFVAGGDFTSTEGAFTVGGGVRANPTDRVTVGIDARLGWETHIRVNGFVGVRFGR